MDASRKYIGIALLLIILVAAGVWVANQFQINDGTQTASAANSAESETNAASGSAGNQSGGSGERIIYRGDPPYLTNQPILDGNLFVNHSDAFLLLGGLNIEQVRYSAGTRAGGRATVVNRDRALAFLMEEQPYIEFSYQEKFYSLQILSRPYFFTMDFREIPSPSIELGNNFDPN